MEIRVQRLLIYFRIVQPLESYMSSDQNPWDFNNKNPESLLINQDDSWNFIGLLGVAHIIGTSPGINRLDVPGSGSDRINGERISGLFHPKEYPIYK